MGDRSPYPDPDLLISGKSGRADFVDKGEIRAREYSGSSVQFSKQLFDSLIVSRLGEMVKVDGQGLGFEIGNEVYLSIEDLAQ